MRQTEFLPAVTVTADDVLDIIRDRYRHAQELDPEVERGMDLTFGSTIAEWRNSCDLLPFTELWPALNSWFGVAFAAPEWREVLEPGEVKTLGGVCALIATQASRPTIGPFPVAGIECWSAGTFLTIRSLLSQAGVPVQNIRPSTLLADYAREYGSVFISEIGRLVPGALPVPKIEHTTAHKVSMAAVCAGFAVMLLAFNWHALFIACMVLLAIGFGGVWISSKYPPKAVKFGDLVTFRDLTEIVLSGENQVI